MGWTGTIINGVLLGGLYGLFGVGLALVFGVTRIVNIMHGEFIALSAFIADITRRLSRIARKPWPPILKVATPTRWPS